MLKPKNLKKVNKKLLNNINKMINYYNKQHKSKIKINNRAK